MCFCPQPLVYTVAVCTSSHPTAAINYQQSQRDKLAMSKPNATSAIRNFILPLPPNPPPSQKESQSSILPSIPAIHLSPWQLISSAVSWYQSRDNAVKGRGKRQAGENVAEGKIHYHQPT